MNRIKIVVSLIIGLSWGCATQPCTCSSPNRPVSVEADDILVIDSLREQRENLEESNAELAAWLSSIQQTDEHDIDLLAALGQRLAQPDALLTTLQSIDFLIEIALKNVSNANAAGYKRRVPRIEGGMLRRVGYDFAAGQIQSTG